MDELNATSKAPRVKERYIVCGSDASGEVFYLESLYDGDDPADRIRSWSRPVMGPFHYDVHIAKETITTSYERIELPIKEA